MAKSKKPRTAKQTAASKKNIKKAIAALKRNKPKSKTKRKNNPGNPGSNTKHKRLSKENAKNFGKGLLGGTGAGEIAGSMLDFVDLPVIVTVPVRGAVSAVGGWWSGQKTLAGLLGGLSGELVTSGIQFLTGRQGGGRLGGPGL